MLNQVVLQATSAAMLVSSPNPSAQGQAATGPVTFRAGKTVLRTAQLSGGKASLLVSSLSVGSNRVTATYYGNSNVSQELSFSYPDGTVSARSGFLAAASHRTASPFI